LDFLQSVLPGPEEASLLIQQKYTTISQNHTANPNFQNSATFLLLAPFFFIVTDNPKQNCFVISAIWQHCFCQGGIDFVKSNSCRTVHATTGGLNYFLYVFYFYITFFKTIIGKRLESRGKLMQMFRY
jgi:hypothetical protein